MIWVQEPVCQLCGCVGVGEGRVCGKCRHSPPALNQIRSLFIFADPLKKFIHQLKYEDKFGIARPLGNLMAQHMPPWQAEPTMIIPVPLHPDRYHERGYNQSELLAKQIAKKYDLPLMSHALQRIRNTPPQMRLNAVERQTNVKNAFQGKEVVVAGQQILLIDDVYTTGATLSAAAQALLTAGAVSVMGYCLAQANSRFQHTY
jgi:ComF family protein